MTDTSELGISRIIKAPRAAVWRAWADPALFEKWWIPGPMTCKVVTMDMRPGGGFVTLMREEGGDFQPHMEGCFLEVVPQERIVFTTVLKEGWQPFEPWLALTSIITLQDEEADTRYVARALHRNPEDSKKHEDMGFMDGWGRAIDQLARVASML